MDRSKLGLVGLVALAVLAGAMPTQAATLELQLVGDNITGVADGAAMWDNGASAAIPWQDATSNDRDAVTPNNYNAPYYHAGQAEVYNGHANVGMVTSRLLYGPATLSGWGFTTVVVGNFDVATGSRAIMALADSTQAIRYLGLSILADGNLSVYYRNSFDPPYQVATTGQDFSDATHVFTADYRAQNDIEVYVDGESVLTYTGNGGAVDFANINRYGLGYLPRSSGGASDGDASYAEARFYTGSWDTGELEGVTDYLIATYTPEPASMGLLLAGAVGLVLKRRRR